MRLFHVSDDPAIAAFEPRPLRVPVDRGPERHRLNGLLVWATDEVHALLCLFPRECPRIVIWPTEHTSGIRTRNAQDWGPPGWTCSRPGRTVTA